MDFGRNTSSESFVILVDFQNFVVRNFQNPTNIFLCARVKKHKALYAKSIDAVRDTYPKLIHSDFLGNTGHKRSVPEISGNFPFQQRISSTPGDIALCLLGMGGNLATYFSSTVLAAALPSIFQLFDL